jgi:molybdenum cofactor cytidylyltransferase
MNLSRKNVPAPGLAALVLAAGGGARFGGPKQLARYGGRPLVARAAAAAVSVCGAGTVVVTGAEAVAVAGALSSLPVTITHNPAWESGLSTSIAAGLAAVPAQAAALLVLLCDQPLVDAADLDALVGAARGFPGRVIAAHYGEVTGVPAIFPKEAWPALRALRGDHGARSLIASLDPVTVEMPHAAFDIDTPADLARLPAEGENAPA